MRSRFIRHGSLRPVAISLAAAVLLAAAPTGEDADRSGTHRRDGGLRAADYDAETFVPPPTPVGKTSVPTARIEVDYIGFSTQARQAFEYAVQIWEEHVESVVTIHVRAEFESLQEGVLASAGPHLTANFLSAVARQNTWYPTALAEAITGRTIGAGDTDISSSFNSDFPNWYFGTDGRTPRGQYDFVTVVLHELGHGLGFTGSFDVQDPGETEQACPGGRVGEGCWGILTSTGSNRFPIIFDHFVEDLNGVPLLATNAYPNPSIVLGQALQSGNVLFDGETVRSVHGDAPVNLYAPDNFEPGSSFSHLDEAAFPPGSPNSLMTPFLARAEAIHTPGAVTCAIFRDMGWPMGPGCQTLFFEGLADAEISLLGDVVRLTWRIAPSSGLQRVDVQMRRVDGQFETIEQVDADPDILATQTFIVEVPSLDPGRYDFRLNLIRSDGSLAPGPELTITVPLLTAFAVIGPYPNPLSRAGAGELRVIVQEQQTVRVDAHNALGHRMGTLYHGTAVANDELRVPLEFNGWASGVYFIRVSGRTFATTRRLALVP